MPRSPQRRDVSRNLRRAQTPAEIVLWEHLRAGRIDGHKFRRQHPIGDFVVDFCCPRGPLIVEVNGGIHRSHRSADVAREELLADAGYRVIRFSNDAIDTDIAEVIGTILLALASPPPSAFPSPSPQARDCTPSQITTRSRGG